MTELAIQLNLPPGLFILREKGEQAYPVIKSRLLETPPNQPLILSFSDVQLMDASFADESIIRLGREIISGEYGERYLLLEGLTESAVYNIEAAIELQHLKIAFLAVQPTGEWLCIGRLEPALLETLKLIADRQRLTAPELGNSLGLVVNAASNRLKRLFDQHLVRRTFEVSDKGLLYTYWWLLVPQMLDGVTTP